MIDSGFFVSFICCNTFSALVFVNCASTNITSCAPSIIVEFVQNWSSGDVNTFIENAWWSFANDGRATTNVNPKNTKLYFKALIFILNPLLTKSADPDDPNSTCRAGRSMTTSQPIDR